MMMPKSKFEVLCRTCLSFEHKLYPVFESQLEDIPLGTKISAVTGLKLLPEDGLPNKICSICKEKAEEAFKFKEKSFSADLTLRNIIKSENDCIESTAQLEKLIVKTEDDNEDNGAEFDTYYSLIGVSADGDDFNELESSERFKTEIPVIETGKFEDSTNDGDIKEESVDESYIFCTKCETTENNVQKSHMCSCINSPTGPTNKRKSKSISTVRKSPRALKKNLQKLDDTFHCIICNQKFRSKEDFSDHMPLHGDTIMLICGYCSKCFLNEEFLKEHLCVAKKETLEKDEDLNAPIPERIDRNVKEIKMKELLGLKCDLVLASIKSCGICKSLYFSEDELIGHYDAEHPELSHKCNFCTKVFASLKTAARHRKTCKHRDKKYTCSTCGLKFINEKSLNKHILRYHEGQDVSIKFMDSKFIETQYQCDTCGKCFYRKELLIKHTRIHMPNAGIHECDVCKKKFHRRDHLRSHVRVHERDRERPDNCLCLYCGRSFSNSSNLIVHMRRHTGEKPYKCDFCGKGFPRSSDLQCHRRSHTGEKPFACHVCGKGFSRSNKLSRHMRVHTGQKPYKCTYCDKAFSQSNDLTLHIRRHTGDKPYICEVCGDRFIQGTALQNHKRVHGHFTEAQSQISELAGSY